MGWFDDSDRRLEIEPPGRLERWLDRPADPTRTTRWVTGALLLCAAALWAVYGFRRWAAVVACLGGALLVSPRSAVGRRLRPVHALALLGAGTFVWLLGVASPLGGSALRSKGRRLLGSGLKSLSPTATRVRARDRREPVLYLRSFRDDERDTNELALSWVFASLGPFIAIGRPQEDMSPLGAAREYVAGEDWQSFLLRRLDEAGLVIIRAGSSGGLLWEIEQVRERIPPERLLLFLGVSDDQETRAEAYAAFRTTVRDTFPHPLPERPPEPTECFVRFDSNWRAEFCGAPDDGTAALGTGSLVSVPFLRTTFARALAPFFADRGIAPGRAPLFDETSIVVGSVLGGPWTAAAFIGFNLMMLKRWLAAVAVLAGGYVSGRWILDALSGTALRFPASAWRALLTMGVAGYAGLGVAAYLAWSMAGGRRGRAHFALGGPRFPLPLAALIVLTAAVFWHGRAWRAAFTDEPPVVTEQVELMKGLSRVTEAMVDADSTFSLSDLLVEAQDAESADLALRTYTTSASLNGDRHPATVLLASRAFRALLATSPTLARTFAEGELMWILDEEPEMPGRPARALRTLLSGCMDAWSRDLGCMWRR